MVLTGLSSATTYYFVAISTSASGVIGYSPLLSLTTTGVPSKIPIISMVAASNVTATTTTLPWTTDVPSTSLVSYVATTNYGPSVLDASLTKTHSVMLTGLTPGARYLYEVVSDSPTEEAIFGVDLTGFKVWAWGNSQTLG